MKKWIIDWWPLLAAIASGLIAAGSIQARVTALEDSAKEAKSDHDLLVEVRTDVSYIKKAIDRIDGQKQEPSEPAKR